MGALADMTMLAGMSEAVDAPSFPEERVFPLGLGEQLAFVLLINSREKACQGTLGDPEKGGFVCSVVSARRLRQ